MQKQTDAKTLSLGVARANISPPVGIKSAGYAVRGPLTAFHDPLYATALVFSDEATGKRGVLVSCDLIDLDAETVREIRAAVQRRMGIAEGLISVVCTHTHYGPDPYRDKASSLVMAYRANLINLIAGAVEEAYARVGPAYLDIGWGTSDIGINRREKTPDGRIVLGNNPTGVIDRAVGVARFAAAEGYPLVTLVNFQTHPVSQDSRTSHISADYPGRMRDVVEMLTGAPCIFLQGACGNINPVIKAPCYDSARTLGTRLGCEVVKVWETLAPKPVSGLDIASASVDLPRMMYGSLDSATRLLAALESDIARLRDEGVFEGVVSWAEKRRDRVCAAIESWTTGVPLAPLTVQVQSWRVGTWALALSPGEVFNQIGAQVKAQSPFENTFFVGYANDAIGYIPVPEAYAEGG